MLGLKNSRAAKYRKRTASVPARTLGRRTDKIFFPKIDSVMAVGRKDQFGWLDQPVSKKLVISPLRMRFASEPMDASSPDQGYGWPSKSMLRRAKARVNTINRRMTSVRFALIFVERF